MNSILKGQIVWVSLNAHKNEQGGKRAAVIIQNDKGNKNSDTTIIVPLSSSKSKVNLPVHVHINKEHFNGTKLIDSTALCDQVRVIDKQRINSVENCFLPDEIMNEIEKAILLSVGFGEDRESRIVWINMNDGIGREQRSEKPIPAVIIQNKTGSIHAHTYIVAPLGHKKNKLLPTQVEIPGHMVGKKFRDTIVHLEQIRVIDKSRVASEISGVQLSGDVTNAIEQALLASFGIQRKRKILKGQIVWVSLDAHKSEQGGTRPAVIIQNNIGNKNSDTTIIVPLTSSKSKVDLPVHVNIAEEHFNGIRLKDSIALCEQVRVIDKQRIIAAANCFLPDEIMNEIEKTILISVGFGEERKSRIVWIDLNDGIGREQRSEKPMPAVVIQNKTGNIHAPTYIVAPIGNKRNRLLPTQVEIPGYMVSSNFRDSVAHLEQIRVIDKSRVTSEISDVQLSEEVTKSIEEALLVSFGIQQK
ncbi:type II toxin-antitoxin system PemK/MazF family toxin [[Brevibacterium] frigoritolerans]|nr:type II toxin-antitoxin system PemK/MazF family toxin [Peribacillus frigoritolerans]